VDGAAPLIPRSVGAGFVAEFEVPSRGTHMARGVRVVVTRREAPGPLPSFAVLGPSAAACFVICIYTLVIGKLLVALVCLALGGSLPFSRMP
jgi:hypothetical protein